jgi:hypothetical protein
VLLTYTWTLRKPHDDRYLAAMTDPRWAHLRWIRLRNPKERPDFLATLG